MSIMKNWEGLKIPFEKIDVGAEKFNTCIGRGGYGWVYKGVLSIDGKDTTVAVKRLNEQFGQGLKEFLTEIQLLSGQEHPNLTSLLAAGTLAVASSSSKEIVNFAPQLKKAGELGEWLEEGIITEVELGEMFKHFKG
ncbi:serine-threonine/tyrosine-protein kinase catalytic domain-containing protein [Tanacetum coccineum]